MDFFYEERGNCTKVYILLSSSLSPSSSIKAHQINLRWLVAHPAYEGSSSARSWNHGERTQFGEEHVE